MKNCTVKFIDNVFEKMTKVGYFLYDLVWEIISVSEKRMKDCIVKIIDNVFEKITKVVYFCNHGAYERSLSLRF